MLKGYAGCHVTRLHILTLGPLSRVMVVKPPFHAQNVENSYFLCAKFSPGQPGQQFHCPGRHSNPVYPPVDWVSPPCLEVCDRHGGFALAAVSGWVSPTGRCLLGKISKEKNVLCLSFGHCPKVAKTPPNPQIKNAFDKKDTYEKFVNIPPRPGRLCSIFGG